LAYKRSKRDVEQNPLALKSVPLDELSRRDRVVAPEWMKDHPLVAGWLKDTLIQRPYSLKKVYGLLSGLQPTDHESVSATDEYLVRFRPEYMVELADYRKTPGVFLAAIVGGKGRFLDAIPVEQWHSPEFCEQAYRTGVPNVDAYIYYYGGENTWRNVLDACGKEYRLPAVVPNDAEQLPSGKRKVDAAPDGKTPVQGIQRLGAVPEILGEIVAMTGDRLSDCLINEEVLLGSRGRRERARVALASRDREAAKLLRQVKNYFLGLLRMPADKQTYRMVMTSVAMNIDDLDYAAPKFKADPAICLKAVNNHRGAMSFVKAEKLSLENYLKVCLAAAASTQMLNLSALEGIDAVRIGSKNYLKVCLTALNSVPAGFFAEYERRYVQWDKLDPADKLELNVALARKGI
jgi:hypothetical protein